MESEDEDMARAIALSLADTEQRPQHQPERNATPGSDDDENEAAFQRELAEAIAASKAESELEMQKEEALWAAAVTSASARKPEAAAAETRSNPVSASTVQSKAAEISLPASVFLSEREKMEKARLERRKRMREEGDATATTSHSADSEHAVKKQRMVSPPGRSNGSAIASDSATVVAGPSRSSGSGSGSAQGLFWDGELRQTANAHVDLDKDLKPVFRFSDIVGPKSEVSFAILSSFHNEDSWLRRLLDSRTPVILVNQPRPEGNTRVKTLCSKWVLTSPFLPNGRGSMHIKLILLFYKDGRLRIAVPTANFVDYDWRDIENSVWVQDVPLRQTPIRPDEKATDFPATLQRVLDKLNITPAINMQVNANNNTLPITSLSELRSRWDWSRVKVKLVASLAGKHVGWDAVTRTGHPALMKAIQELGARAGKGRSLSLECQGSSIGTYSTQWMNEFFCSARGASAETWLDKPKSQRESLPWPAVKIIYPSNETVKSSKLGYRGGGTMFCRTIQWAARKFPRELFHDPKSKRGRVLMHSKMIIGTLTTSPGQSTGSSSRSSAFRASDDTDDSNDSDFEQGSSEHAAAAAAVAGWAYVGSHNFTPSAWGTLSGKASAPTLYITNYEMGIVFALRDEREIDDVACWERPARRYDLTGHKPDRAWIQEEVLKKMSRS